MKENEEGGRPENTQKGRRRTKKEKRRKNKEFRKEGEELSGRRVFLHP
jgi:hypothetical protein